MIDLAPATHAFQARLIGLTDQAHKAVSDVVASVWARVVAAMQAKDPVRARALAFHALTDLTAVPGLLRARLGAIADATADHITRSIAAAGGVMAEAAQSFKNPTKARAEALVRNAGWQARMEALTRLADPKQLADAIAAGVAAGESPAKLAKRIRPLVGNIASAARRVARTEAVRVAHEIELETYEGLGEAVVGYEIHATLDQHTRPEHRARDGRKYWRHPAPGELGFDQMPRPPLEADGSVAHNCRCYLSPILDDGTRPERPAAPSKAVIPDGGPRMAGIG